MASSSVPAQLPPVMDGGLGGAAAINVFVLKLFPVSAYLSNREANSADSLLAADPLSSLALSDQMPKTMALFFLPALETGGG